MSQATAPGENEDVVEESDETTVPKPLRGGNITARVLRQKVWRPPNQKNDWCVFVIVGREGSGKSHTTLSILEKADPTFTAERVHFDPEQFLRCINQIPKDDRRGKAIMLDESGVGMGVRSWYDSEQMKVNKLMQTARDDNMIVGVTLPRLSELDSQFRGRLHGFCEMRDVVPGEHAEFSWKNVSPTRDENDKIYKKYPRMKIGRRKCRVTRLHLGPPSDELAEAYEQKKTQFKEQLYDDTIDDLSDDDGDEELSEKEVAEKIKDSGDISQYVSTHAQNKTKYIDKDLIQADHQISIRKAKRVKKVLERDGGVEL